MELILNGHIDQILIFLIARLPKVEQPPALRPLYKTLYRSKWESQAAPVVRAKTANHRNEPMPTA